MYVRFCVLAVPDSPRNINVTDVTHSSLNITWDAPRSDGGAKIRGYYVEKRTTYSSRWSKVNKTMVKETELSLSDLLEGDEYEFRVYAVNDAGDSEPSDSSGVILVKDPFGEHSLNISLWLHLVSLSV